MIWYIATAVVAIVWFIAVLNLELESDLAKWEDDKDVKHRSKPVTRGLLLAPGYILLGMAIHPWWVGIIVSAFVFGAAWWLFFDGFYNIRRGFHWGFNGSPVLKDDDSILDQVLRRMSDFQELCLKIGLLIGFIFVYIKLLL
jgi:hypothetical protein